MFGAQAAGAVEGWGVGRSTGTGLARGRRASDWPMLCMEQRDEVSLIDDASIEAIARRVAQPLATAGGRRLVTAGELAERLGVERSWVYANARRLGGLRLSDGPRAQLRFDAERALQSLRQKPLGASERPRGARRCSRKAAVPAGVELLRGRRNKTL